MFHRKHWRPMLLALGLSLGLAACASDDSNDTTPPPPVAAPTTFSVQIENRSFNLAESGVFGSGPATPGSSHSFSFTAVPGDKLSFATMYGQSNDLFFAPDEAGIALFDVSDNPVTGDVTSQVMLWDAGTEVNQEPGVGADQAPRQSGPDTGAAEGGTVRPIGSVFDGYVYPRDADAVHVTITPR